MNNSVRILVIDDAPDFRALIGKLLTSELGAVEVLEYDPIAQGLPDATFDGPPTIW